MNMLRVRPYRRQQGRHALDHKALRGGIRRLHLCEDLLQHSGTSFAIRIGIIFHPDTAEHVGVSRQKARQSGLHRDVTGSHALEPDGDAFAHMFHKGGFVQVGHTHDKAHGYVAFADRMAQALP